MSDLPASPMLQLQSLVREDATLELSLVDVDVPAIGDTDVLVQIEAAPINPSDLGVLFGPADVRTARQGGTPERPTVSADIPKAAMTALAPRIGVGLPAGNEGAGTVVAAGSAPEAQALLGRTVAVLGGATYAQYRATPVALCLPLPEGTTAKQGASCFVNPLTALGMVETMKLEGHSALVHTAAASNLGQMLVKLCAQDGVPLVNVVRREEHVALLEGLGAKFVCNSSDEDFAERLVDAIAETGATLGFDATGGGTLAGQILAAMETAQSRNATEFSRYGSATHKQLYIYGGLDRSPTVLNRAFGMAWGLGGWLLPPFLQRIGGEAAQRLRERVASEITTTFASHYTKEISLTQALQLDTMLAYGRQATGEKVLILPNQA